MLRRVHLEQSTTVFFMKPYVPDAVVQAARNPLSNQIASLLCLHEVLIAVYVRDVPESLSFDLITDWMSAEDKQYMVLHPLFNLRWNLRRLTPGSGLINILTTSGPFRCRHRTVFRNLAELKLRSRRMDMNNAFFVLRHKGTSPGHRPSLIKNIRPQIAHERIESSACSRQRLGISHLLSIRFLPCVRLLLWGVRRCLVSHEGG